MELRMNTAKDEVRKLLDRLPEEASFEDIQYQVYVLDEIRRGSEEIDRGDVIEHEEVKRRLAKWLDK
jgi:predicted transcriptional regulator